MSVFSLLSDAIAMVAAGRICSKHGPRVASAQQVCGEAL